MKITLVMGFFLPVPALAGGATEKIWYRLGQLMAEAGHDVTIITRRWPGLPNRESVGNLVLLRLPGMNHTRHLASNLALDFVWGLRVLRSLPPADVVVCNTVSLPAYLGWLKPSAGRVAVVLGRMPKGQNRVYGGVDLVLATSEAVANKALQENPGLAPRLITFPNPMDWSLHQRASTQGTPGRPLTIGYVGRIHPEKGLEQMLAAGEILAANPSLPPWRMVFIGPVSVQQGGGGEAYRDQLATTYGARLGGRVHFEPPVFNSEELARHYGGIDLFCYPSLAAKGEGLSIAPIEAMAAGAVPVVSQLDCYRDLIVPGRNGFQFDQTQPGAVAELAAHFIRLLSDADLRRTVAQRAQETARRFDYHATAAFLLAAFERLPQPRRNASPIL
jgi:glycosyltransferase involved in cell wall biosynthesis